MPSATATLPAEPLRRAMGLPAGSTIAVLSSGGGGPFAQESVIAQTGLAVHAADGDGARLLDALSSDHAEDSGWFALLSYGLGASIEPRARHAQRQHHTLSGDGSLMRAHRRWAFDHPSARWHGAGLPAEAALEPLVPGTLEPQTSDAAFMHAVARTRELIRAGDLFQANIARHWTGLVPMDARAWALGVLARVPARYGAYLELGDGRAVLSLSPELFLSVDASTRRVRTRPIKGTRAAGLDTHELEHCAKERSELAMIVDLMRNDLGRVCSVGTVQVSDPRSIEHHPTIQHAVAEVRGVLRPGVGHAELVRATFPPGSVTGAPKVRAMQVIDELEEFDRGPYCGAIGWLGDDGAVNLSVAIRTFSLQRTSTGTRVDYWTGCGIVADSDPQRECAESHEKAAVALIAVGATHG